MQYSLYDPLIEQPIESGIITRDEFETLYLNFPWIEMLAKLNEAKEENVKCSPGVTIENRDGKGISISIVGDVNEYEIYICYKRPTQRKKRRWFKIIEYLDKDYCSILPQQTLEEGLKASLYLFDKNYQMLEEKYG